MHLISGAPAPPVWHCVAARDTITLETDYGPIRVKRKWLAGEVVSAAPEYDDVGAEWQTVMRAIGKTL